MESNSVCNQVNDLTKSDDREAGVWLVDHEYDYRDGIGRPLPIDQNIRNLWNKYHRLNALENKSITVDFFNGITRGNEPRVLSIYTGKTPKLSY